MKAHKSNTPAHEARVQAMAARRQKQHQRAAAMPAPHSSMFDERTGKSKYIPAGRFKNIK